MDYLNVTGMLTGLRGSMSLPTGAAGTALLRPVSALPAARPSRAEARAEAQATFYQVAKPPITRLGRPVPRLAGQRGKNRPPPRLMLGASKVEALHLDLDSDAVEVWDNKGARLQDGTKLGWRQDASATARPAPQAWGYSRAEESPLSLDFGLHPRHVLDPGVRVPAITPEVLARRVRPQSATHAPTLRTDASGPLSPRAARLRPSLVHASPPGAVFDDGNLTAWDSSRPASASGSFARRQRPASANAARSSLGGYLLAADGYQRGKHSQSHATDRPGAFPPEASLGMQPLASPSAQPDGALPLSAPPVDQSKPALAWLFHLSGLPTKTAA